MKYILTVIAVLFVLFVTSCSGSGKDKGEIFRDKFYTKLSTQEGTQNKIGEVLQNGIKDPELDNLVESFVFPPMTTDNLNFDEEYKGLPIKLINLLKKRYIMVIQIR